MAENKNIGVRENSVVVTARRALGLNKTYIFIAVLITALRLTVINPSFLSAIGSLKGASSSVPELSLFTIPFDVLPALMLATTIVILFVYDKNNGVLEYLLSLGMTQRDIYLRYLYAALLMSCAYLAILIGGFTLYTYASSGIGPAIALLPTFAIGAMIALSTVAFAITVMMAFSVLQKSRAGGNQPLAMTVAIFLVVPDYFLPFAFPFGTAILLEIAQAVTLAFVALAVILLSPRLIRREKLLP